MENSRLRTKSPCTRAVTLVIRRCMIEVVFTKQLTPEQFGPGLVSTSCISLETTSAVLADELNDVRIADEAIRTKAIFIALEMKNAIFPYLTFIPI